MGLSEHDHKKGPAKSHRAGSFRGLRRFLASNSKQSWTDSATPASTSSGQTREESHEVDSIRIAPSNDLNTDHEKSHTAKSLWDCAYEFLEKENPSLVEKYEYLLSEEAKTSTYQQHFMQRRGNIDHLTDSAPDNVTPPSTTPPANRSSRRAQLDAIIQEGLRRVENMKTKYTIAGHEFVLGDQIAQSADLVLWAKGLIGEAVKSSSEASIAWAGVCIILPLLTNPRVADEANRDGFTYVTTRMRYYTALEPLLLRLSGNAGVTRALMEEANGQIVVLYRHVLEFQIRSVLRFYQSSIKGYVKDVFSPNDWKQLRINIENLDRTVNENFTQMNEFLSRQELESLNDKSENALEIMERLLRVLLEQPRSPEQYLQLFRLTSSSKDATYEWYKDRVEDRVKGTCEWFLHHKNFQTWLKQGSGPLMVSADPGCGKSVLAKYLIDHELPRSSSATICYFFFKDQDQNTVRQALCALLHQLLSKQPRLIKYAAEQFKENGPGLINSTHSLWTILENAVQDPQAGSIILVLDALDECAELELEYLLMRLESQFCSAKSISGKLKYLLTSRPYEQIVSKFQTLLDIFPYVRIPGEEESETISQEVNYVIDHRVEQLAKEKNLSNHVKDHLTKELLRVPHRTYLWVYLTFEHLHKEHFKKTVKGVDSTIATLPKSVYQAYEQILSKSKEDPMVRVALSIVLAATRPLTLLEMNIAVNIDDTARSIYDLDLEEEDDFKSRLRSWCGLFISTHHGKIYFLHQTAREFLLADLSSAATIPSELHWRHCITIDQAHTVLAELCVRYLDFFNSDDKVLTGINEEEDHGIDRAAFLDYSAESWSLHFREASINDGAAIIPATLRICDPGSKSYKAWLELYWLTTKWTSTKFTALLLCSHLGHEVTVKQLLETEADLEFGDKRFGLTPLSWAAIYGHEAVVKQLLDKEANLESKDRTGLTPLSWAAARGHKAVVKQLLDKGANLDSKDKDGRTPLSWAALGGHEAVVQQLLDKGPNLELNDSYGRTPLLWAALGGHKAVVKLLLEKGSNPESKDEDGRTPLSWAVEEGHEAVIKLLREKEASLDLKVNFV
ncbi:hypothetical protein PEBR_01131 [Penicillium brasilianum]|uniref:Uncharacterized protein n=1 Tax=Penicillium brasilianum TaxID=104259 RepID=A0A1S9S1R1_PENBI|nr:hypothetical protein PEBR_01131 [Penicillium brasilianum]